MTVVTAEVPIFRESLRSGRRGALVTLAKMFGWIFAAVLAAVCLRMFAGLGWLVIFEDPRADPLPVAR